MSGLVSYSGFDFLHFLFTSARSMASAPLILVGKPAGSKRVPKGHRASRDEGCRCTGPSRLDGSQTWNPFGKRRRSEEPFTEREEL